MKIIQLPVVREIEKRKRHNMKELKALVNKYHKVINDPNKVIIKLREEQRKYDF